MSRRPAHDNSFGSDSFLDVVANIVGILIILIVVAGVRVSRAPLLSIHTPDSQNIEELDSATETTGGVFLESLDSLPADPPIVVDLVHEAPPKSAAPWTPPPVQPLPALPDVTVPQDLIALTEKLTAQAEKLSAQIDTTTQSVTSLEDRKAAFSSVLSELDSAFDLLLTRRPAQQSRLQRLASETQQIQKVVDQLQADAEDAKARPPQTEKLAHRLNPVGRTVTGKEIHFRLHGNRVSHVPILELAELVKQDMRRRQDFLFRQPRFQSTVGPVQGYEMEYLVQRQGGSLLEPTRIGSGMVRISLTDWVIHPTEQVHAETYEQAIAENSLFRRAVIAQGTNVTVTFWVYPDSFQLHRQLKQLAQDSGLWVASRPLPANVRIQGSSSGGSKSVAQ